MRRSTLLMCALLMIATSGCKQINEQWTKVKARIAAARQRIKPTQPAPTPPAPAVPQADTAMHAAVPPPPSLREPPHRRVPQAPELPRPTHDVPYESPNTGTIDPGMAEREIYSLWGPPIAVRRQGEFTYLYYRNGCEYTCGTEDVVFLQNGKVVDAVLRWPGHEYSGQSSSPAATPPHGPVRPGGDTLTVKTPSTP